MKTNMIIPAACALVLTATAGSAEVEFSFYTGFQEAAHSRVRGTDPGNAVNENLDFLVGWQGRSFEAPPYYGFRATWWQNEKFGFGVDFNHAKVYAPDGVLRDNGFKNLELTDGLNILTVNAYRRFPGLLGGNITPYAGAGVGLSIPHVDVESDGGKTFEYQTAGAAATWMLGGSYAINEKWSVFGEYKGTYSSNKLDLKSGGEIKTNIITNAVNFGVSFGF